VVPNCARVLLFIWFGKQEGAEIVLKRRLLPGKILFKEKF
jgi:hypothetical protein